MAGRLRRAGAGPSADVSDAGCVIMIHEWNTVPKMG